VILPAALGENNYPRRPQGKKRKERAEKSQWHQKKITGPELARNWRAEGYWLRTLDSRSKETALSLRERVGRPRNT